MAQRKPKGHKMKIETVITLLKICLGWLLAFAILYSCTVSLDKTAQAQTMDYCTPEMPAYYKPWIVTGQTPCDWAGYTCNSFEDCNQCNVLVSTCHI